VSPNKIQNIKIVSTTNVKIDFQENKSLKPQEQPKSLQIQPSHSINATPQTLQKSP
jgi:hypothetical protein